MATGDIRWFSQALLDIGNKIHDLTNDTLKLGIVTAAPPPSLSTAAPHWGGTGTTDFSATQVTTAGSQYTGPKTLASVTWSLVSNVATLRAADVVMTIDPLGFTDGAFAIIFNDTDANKRALGFVELSAGGTLDLTAGNITIDWGGSGTDILTLTQA